PACCGWARDCARRGGAHRSAAVRQFSGRRLRRAPRRSRQQSRYPTHGDRARDRGPCRRPRLGGGGGGAHPHPRSHAGRRRHGLHAGRCAPRRRRRDRTVRTKSRRKSAACGRGLARRLDRPARGPPPCRAARRARCCHRSNCGQRVSPRARRGVLDRDEIVEPGKPPPGAALFEANRYLLIGLIERLGAVATDLGILPDDPERLARAIGAAAAEHDLVVTSGGVSTGEADHVRHAVETVGRLVFWRVAIKPGRPVAMGVIPGRSASAAFVGLPGNPAAVYVTFARVVRPLLLRLAGAESEPLLALPVRAGFAYRKKAGRREYVRVKLARAADGAVEAIKHAQEGAGIITSVTETDGLVELPEDTTTVTPGATVGFFSYAALAA